MDHGPIAKEIVRQLEYSINRTRSRPIREYTPTKSVIERVKKEAEGESAFDEYGLRLELWNAYIRGDGGATIRQFSDGSSQFTVICAVGHPVRRLDYILSVWSRVCQLFGVCAKIIWFAHPMPRTVVRGGPGGPGPGQINGGYCIRCNPNTIVIYRAEDATRVLIHELLHATCSDSRLSPLIPNVPYIESEAEAWAEIIHAILFNGVKGVNAQLEYSVRQNKILRDIYSVTDPESYAWRYTVGKEDVWRRIGFALPVAAAFPLPRVPRTLSLSLSLTNTPHPK